MPTIPPGQRPFAVVVGADSLRIRRSGIGRMTLEIVQAIHNRPEIGGLRLLIAGKLHLAEPVLAKIAATPNGELFLPPIRIPRPGPALHAKRLVADVPGVQRLRRLKDHLAQRSDLRDLTVSGAGRVLYHEPNMIPQSFAGPTVVTVNDLSWFHHPEHHPRERLDWIDRNLKRTLTYATRFVAISRFTASAMVRELGIDPARIDVVPLAAGPQFKPVNMADAAAALARHGLHDRGYVLSVSTLEPRKNFDRLMAAHAALPGPLRQGFPLVIAGGSGWGSTLVSPAAERARREGSLRLLGHVDDRDLLALYARAGAFAYVSIYEGFGLPLLEAMAAGAAVVASSTTATGETTGDAGMLVDPLDADAIAAGLRRVLEDDALAEDLRHRGMARAARFTWERTATGLIASWQRALG